MQMDSEIDADLSKRFLPQLLSIEGLHFDEKVSVVFDMMLAAIDTTTYSTFRALFFLSKNQEAQVRENGKKRER